MGHVINWGKEITKRFLYMLQMSLEDATHMVNLQNIRASFYFLQHPNGIDLFHFIELSRERTKLQNNESFHTRRQNEI
jgi:hypothetical protein